MNHSYLMNSSFSSLSFEMQLLRLLKMIPALENSLSTGAELHGTDRSCRAKAESCDLLRSVQNSIAFIFNLGCAKYISISVLASLVAFPVPITPSASKILQKSINFFLLVGSCVIGCGLGWLTWLPVVVGRRAFTACFTSSEEKAKNLLSC